MTAPVKINASLEGISNPRHQLFADTYLVGGSATQAAIDVGYSVRTAGVQAAQLLKRPEISSYIANQRSVQSIQALTTRDKVIRELGDMAFFNAEDVSRVNEQGHLEIDFSNAESRHYKAVTKIKTKHRVLRDNKGQVIGEETTAEVGLADKYRGLELLGKIEGLFKEPEQRVVVDVADRLLRARGRLIDGTTGKDIEE